MADNRFGGTGNTGGSSKTPGMRWAEQSRRTPMQGGTALSRDEFIERSSRTAVGHLPRAQSRPQPSGGRPEPESRPGPEWMQKRAIAFNKANRRELTEQEWQRLSGVQQKQVRLNTDLTRAYDADMVDSRDDRSNTKAVLAQLGLDEQPREALEKNLRVGMGPVARYGDLFQPGGEPVRKADSPYQFGDTGAGTIPRATDARQRLVNSISTKLSTYVQNADGAKLAGDIERTDAVRDQYTFASEDAKLDFEEAFNSVSNVEMLGQMNWTEAAANLRKWGYNPEDFKAYALDRIELMPRVDGMASSQDLASWFGKG